MSTCCRAIRLATAFAGDVDIRWRSSNQRIWISVASGMKRVVKRAGRPGSSFAQPTRIMLAVGLLLGPGVGLPRDRLPAHGAVEDQAASRAPGGRWRRPARLPSRRTPRGARTARAGRRDDRLKVAEPAPRSEKSSTDQSDMPKPRSSYRITVASCPSCSRKCRQTGLCQSYCRCPSQHDATTSGGPLPWIAYASRVPSAARQNRISWSGGASGAGPDERTVDGDVRRVIVGTSYRGVARRQRGRRAGAAVSRPRLERGPRAPGTRRGARRGRRPTPRPSARSGSGRGSRRRSCRPTRTPRPPRSTRPGRRSRP